MRRTVFIAIIFGLLSGYVYAQGATVPISCTASRVNTSYSDTVNNIQYLCTTAGWKANTGIGAPTVGCSAVNYGSLYVDVSSGTAYTCGQTGWVVAGAGGSGTVSGQGAGIIPLGTSATVIGNQSHCDDGITTAGTVTCTEPLSIGTGLFTTTIGPLSTQSANYAFDSSSPSNYRSSIFADLLNAGTPIGTNSASPNYNPGALAPDAGFAFATMKQTGTNFAFESLSPPTSITPGGGQPLGDLICAKGNDLTIANINISAYTLTGTAASLTVASDPRSQYLVGESFQIANVSPSSLNGACTITAMTSTTISCTATGGQSGSYVSGGNTYMPCTNSSDATSAATQAFATTLTIPAPSSYPISYSVKFIGQIWTTATVPTLLVPSMLWGAFTVGSWNGTAASLRTSAVGTAVSEQFSIYLPYSGFIIPSPDFQSFGLLGNTGSSSPVSTTTSGATISFKTGFTATGLSTATYVSGGSPSGTGNVTLSGFNDSCNGTTATMAVAGGTPGAITVTNTGFACTVAPTTATCTSGTATCSGSVTITSTLGGTQGNAVKVDVLKALLQL